MNIVCATDDNYVPLCGIMLTSLLENNRDSHVDIYILTKGLNLRSRKLFSKLLQKNNYDAEIHICEVNDEIFKYCPVRVGDHISLVAYYRFLIPYILPRLVDKVLYLDCDIMFNRDIHLLYDYDISEVEYAASSDHYGKYLIHPGYINAGVLLFNLKKCRETELFSKARDLIRKKKLVFADQSAIIRSTTKRLHLPQRFNDQKFLHKHTVVRHFSKRLFYLPYPHTDNIKQWHVEKVHRIFHYHQFDDIYEEYLTRKKEGFHYE